MTASVCRLSARDPDELGTFLKCNPVRHVRREPCEPTPCLVGQFTKLGPTTPDIGIHADEKTVRLGDKELPPVVCELPGRCNIVSKR